jgi:hypothetical protein
MRQMRRRLLVSSALAVVAAAPVASAQDLRVPSPLFGGNNVRITAGQSSLLGGTHNWNRGLLVGAAWESWDPGSGGELGRGALGLAAAFTRLPFSPTDFLADFNATSGLNTTSATARDATMVDIQVTLRVRGPRLIVLPSALLAIGYYNFSPGTVTFAGGDSSGTARLRSKSGPSMSLGAALDAPYVGRAALFAEAMYIYGYSSESQLRVTAGAVCGTARCETLKSTQTASVRAGLRFRISR